MLQDLIQKGDDKKGSQAGGLLTNLNQEFKEREIAQKAKQMGIGYINLTDVPINPDILQIIDKEDSEKGKIIVFFAIGKKIRIAMTEPNNQGTKDVIIKLEKKEYLINKNLCSAESLKIAQSHYASDLIYEEEEIVAKVEGKIENTTDEMAKMKDMPKKMKKMKSDEALNVIHEQILKFGASDLHFEPKKGFYHIRARVNGVLTHFFDLDSETSVGIIRQIKHGAHLKFNITNIPQDGKYFFQATGRRVDVRVSTLPTNYGEALVMRFLDPNKGLVPITQLGFSRKSLGFVYESLKLNNGLIMVTGPTGSGKTTTLHSCLHSINTPDKKIITLENPVEYEVDGVVQSEVNEEDGYTFASGLRALMRQDPDIIMLGEVRDLSTAETAVEASLTGHLVLATLHTNSAADALPRLLNMGIEPFVLAPALRCVIAQRLVRLVCKKCRKFREPTDQEKRQLDLVLQELAKRGENFRLPPKVAISVGCPFCAETGFQGRAISAEVLSMNDEIELLIYERANSQKIQKVAVASGMRTMREEGVLKVLAGLTTVDEILRSLGG